MRSIDSISEIRAIDRLSNHPATVSNQEMYTLILSTIRRGKRIAMKLPSALFAVLLLSACGVEAPKSASPPASPPNILLIVVDDMGYTDIGAFGGEIRTPNIDELALGGLRLTNFHASAQCAPTRSMLMSGADNHKAGVGSMFGSRFIKGGFGERWGYEGYLHPRVATLPERLSEAGYNTYMTGKWHLGADDKKKPTARGFDRAFALMAGAGSHFDMRSAARPAVYREDGELLDELPHDFYSTNTYTEKMIEYVASGLGDGKPFFGYLALTSPHWPLQVPVEYLDRYGGEYDDGYDVLRAKRIERAEALGVILTVDPEMFQPTGERWNQLSEDEQRYSARTMELYAAMLENTDDNIGRLVEFLKENGELENTFVFFMSDNGSEADRDDRNPTHVGGIARNDFDNNYDKLGTADSWTFIREGWAQATMAPFRLYKGFLTEGGTRVTSFAYYPAMAEPGGIDNQYLTVMDVMPTLLDLAGAEFDSTRLGNRAVEPMDGKSFRAALSDSNVVVHPPDEVIASELHGQRSLVRGDYKLLWEQMTVNVWWEGETPDYWGRWRLYNLAEDPTEQHDLADAMPELVAELVALWDEWANANSIKREVEPYWPAH